MKTNVASLTGMIFFLTVGSVMAEKPLRDYSFIRGPVIRAVGGIHRPSLKGT
jgi:hypothetical protein